MKPETGSIPVMLDVSCNCYSMIGFEGWIEVAGVLTKLGCMLALLIQLKNLPSFQNFWKYQKNLENTLSITISGKFWFEIMEENHFSIDDFRDVQPDIIRF